ncbi:DUF3006 domain-containing protein [Deinococcus peraridilitoris]|uniref:DUF3006 domain-containing protein n=1 Tax=Deinococcus peraridilitoris (strain DSM 19664 / LMG 22246 / CIP 109416 / KR-200) TaxID=937777 RepID=L0A8H2_DEIPD|nr:DUF3006 domain-containing protein [Deinococcus peraridilitoris]AFZ69380.1 Protein of unknown function (DUF3006) [Deinococcus peraridilitoris DSM 19664]
MADRFVIERFEEDLVVIEWHDRSLDLPRVWLPQAAQEGDHLKVIAKDGHVTFEIDAAATQQALQANQQALNALNAKDDGGDLDL